MRAQAFGLLGGTVLLCGATLAACSASTSDSSAAGAGAPSAGAGSVTGSAGAPSGGAPAGGAPSGGALGVAGAGAGPAQAGSGGAAVDQGGAGAGGGKGGNGGSSGSGSAGGAGTAGSGGGSVTPIPDVKFVIYIDDWTSSYAAQASKIDFAKVTHVNLAFVEATTANDWKWVDGQTDANVKVLVDKAHAAGAKVLASLGGGGTDTTVSDQYKNPANDDLLVSNLDTFLTRLNLDGADIDIEKESRADVGDNYGTFVSKVVDKLRPQNKLVTAAVAQYLAPAMNDSTLKLFDFVNLMVYSNGTSPYVTSLNFYLGKGMKKTQLTLGIISESGQHSSTANTQAITALSKSWGGAMLWDVAEDSAGVYKDIQSAL